MSDQGTKGTASTAATAGDALKTKLAEPQDEKTNLTAAADDGASLAESAVALSNSATPKGKCGGCKSC